MQEMKNFTVVREVLRNSYHEVTPAPPVIDM